MHIWNESPSKPAYPQWDARGGVRVYGPDYAYLVVLTPIPTHRRAGATIDWHAEPLRAPGVEGVRLVRGEQVDTVLFRRYGGPYALGDVVSDADKVVIREAGGQVRSWAVVQGTMVKYKGRTLIVEPQPTNRAMDL